MSTKYLCGAKISNTQILRFINKYIYNKQINKCGIKMTRLHKE
jgi:hypothetical protein